MTAVIDAHVHVIPDAVLRRAASDPWFAACHADGKRIAGERELLAYLDRSGVDGAVVFTWPFADPRLCAEANDYVAEMQRRHPDRVIGCGIVQPRDPGAAAELQRLSALGLRGIGELNADAQDFALDDPILGELAQVSADLGLSWTVHCSEPVGHVYPGKGTATPDRVVRFLETVGAGAGEDGLRVIAAHLGGGLPFYAHMPEVRELCRRIWFDTAAVPFLYAPSALGDVARLVGADRLLLGTDFPLLRMRRYEEALTEAGFSDAEFAMIRGGNAGALWVR
jgi:predicted TIM-barrel fold metal-dependent hydrolase